MKTLFNSLLIALIAFAALSQPAYADDDKWRHRHHDYHGHGNGHWKQSHWRHNRYPYIVYEPARMYYYAPPRVVYYPQPVYAQPVYSFTWFTR